MSPRKKLLKYLCITVTILLAFCSAPTNGVTEGPISTCISENSILARTGNCKCLLGGRGGGSGRSCGFSSVLVDLVCSGVSAIDLPAGEVYDNLTCL